MKKITLIVGARPNYMKAYPIYSILKDKYNLTIIHTGQHFDEKMYNIFFNQLNFPKPDITLTLESKNRAGKLDDKLYVNNIEYLKNKNKVIEDLININKNELGQLGEIRNKLIIEFKKINPDLVLVFGDVTSTLSASLAAHILKIKIAHIESGLRSFDLFMPEEVNRILIDKLTTYFFITEPSGEINLKKENYKNNLFLVGNTMIDCIQLFKEKNIINKL